MQGELEFEIERGEASEKVAWYDVKRKGMKVGILLLDGEPYSRKEATKDTMTLR